MYVRGFKPVEFGIHTEVMLQCTKIWFSYIISVKSMCTSVVFSPYAAVVLQCTKKVLFVHYRYNALKITFHT